MATSIPFDIITSIAYIARTQITECLFRCRYMKEVALKDFCLSESQTRAGEVMGCSQSAVHQALKAGREIYFLINEQGLAIDWYEVKRPARAAAPA
jgi:hypothetical protein